MDTITHVAIGATIGHALLGRRVGKKALYIGAGIQCLPDIDFIAALWMGPAENLLAHRGFTHSFLFTAFMIPGIAYGAQRWVSSHVSLKWWSVLAGLQLIIHLLVDACNVYGVGWFEPFSHDRITFNNIFVADPFYSAALVIGLAGLLITRRTGSASIRWAIVGLALSTLYLVYTFIHKRAIDNDVTHALREQGIENRRFFATPTAFNNWLWYIVAENDSGYHLGYRSIFDQTDTIAFHYVKRNHHLLKTVSDHESVQHLIRFSKGYYIVQARSDTLLFSDLRFGQIAGWHDPNADFVFRYYLQHPHDNLLAVQRGRFSGWNTTTVKSLLNRIRGVSSQ